MATRRKKNENSVNQGRYKYIGALLVIFAIVGIVLIKLFPPFSFETLSVAVAMNNNSGAITLFDFNEDSIKTYLIPEKTEISVSNQRGFWKMESLWKLIESENLNPKVYSDSLMRSFKVPIEYWADEKVMELTSNNLITSLKAVFRFRSSNLSFRNRVRLFWFARGVRTKNREILDLSDTSYLNSIVLGDGESGYEVSQDAPRSVLGAFSDPSLVDSPFRIQIVNQEGTKDDTAKSVANIIETLGANVLDIDRSQGKIEGDCEIFVKTINKGVEKIANVLTCKLIEKEGTNFDAVIVLGQKFYERF